MNALEEIAAQAARHKKKIVLAEGADARVLAAAGRVVERGLAEILLIGNPDAMAASAKSEQVNLANCRLIDPRQNDQAEKHADILARARKHKGKGITREQALEQIRSPLTLAVCMVACGDADGCVAGATNTTTDVIRAALQVVGVKPASGLVSSFFLMQHDLAHQAIQGTAIYADCALVIDPDAEQLAGIAIASADSAKNLAGLEPKVALLSFSTAGSAKHPNVDKVIEAGRIISQKRPDLALMTEVQFDSAILTNILKQKAPNISVDAPANVFIFPELQSANIGYKIAQRIGGVTAVGPILQGLKHPVNDLSRGCSVQDIVQLVAVTSVQAAGSNENRA